MAEKKPQYPIMTTAKGIASFSHLAKPDTEGKYADDKYKTTVLLSKAGSEQQAEIDAFIAEINKLHAKHKGKKKTESPIKDGDDKEKDGKPDERYAGKWYFTAKSKFQPQLLNARGKELDSKIEIRGGDIIRVAVAPVPYDEGKNAGISLQLRAVKLIEKRAGADYSGAFGDDDSGEDDTPQDSGGDGKASGGSKDFD